MKTIANITGCIRLASVGPIMYENEPSRGASSSKRSEDVCSRDLEDYCVFNGDFVPCQGEALASNEDGDKNGGDEEDEEDDDDGILPS